MKVSVTLKLIVLPCVVYATWSLTSSLMAQQPKKRAFAPTAGVASKVIVDRVPEAVTSGAPGYHPNLASASLLTAFSLDIQGRSIAVHAAVDLMNRNPTPSHLWRLKVTNLGDDTVVSDVPYVGQRFQVPKSGLMQPTFDETLGLPAGKYRALLSLYRIPNGVEVRGLLNDDYLAMSASLISVPRDIEIN